MTVELTIPLCAQNRELTATSDSPSADGPCYSKSTITEELSMLMLTKSRRLLAACENRRRRISDYQFGSFSGFDIQLRACTIQLVSDVTRILDAVQQGDSTAADQLLPLVYEELRKLAAHKMAHQPPGQTLQATALVHEAYLRLIGNEPVQWNSRGHFFSAAAEAMRRILIERARKRSARKHGGGLQRVDLDHVEIALDTSEDLLLLLNDALEEFREKDPTAAELIKLRFFVGLGNDQAAQLLGVSARTAKRSWAYARAWLYHRMQEQMPNP